jgi:hypothetical protein
MSFSEELQIELLKTALSAIVTVGALLLTWFGGQKILDQWDLRKKRKEIDIQTAQRFHELVGEWKAVWRAWQFLKKTPPKGSPIVASPTARWDLFDRAAKAEGGIEAILLRLSIERQLCGCERKQLGLFRQSFQQLREAIRDDKGLAWNRGSKEYWFAHELAIRVSLIIEREPPQKPLTATDGKHQLEDILAVTGTKWNVAIKKLPKNVV